MELRKDRLRWHIHYQGVLFYINIDQLLEPEIEDTFLEIKTRTWSLVDAQNKAESVRRMLDILGITPEDAVRQEYVEMHKAEAGDS